MKTVIHLYNPSENGVVEYGFIDSPFGRCLAAFNYSGLCSFEFVDSEERAAAVLRRVWADSWVGRNRAFDRISFEGLLYDGKNPLPLCFRGTTFQSAVWQALLRIAPGETMTYAEVAAAVGCPGAVRQVGHRGKQIGRGRTVPPRRVRRRRWRRIPLGPGAEEGDSGLGADGHVGGITALPQQDAAKTADGLSGVAGLFIFVRPEHVAV